MTDSGFDMARVTGSKSTMAAVIGAIIVVIGSFTTWVTIEGVISFGGMSDGGDGIITLVVGLAAAAAAIFLKDRARMIAVAVGGAIIIVTALVDIFDILGTDFASVGFGLWLVLVGGVVVGAAAFVKD